MIEYLGIIVNIIGIVWTILGICSNKNLGRALIKEKDMIRQRILDFKNRLDVYRKRLDEDKKIQSDQTLNTIHIRIEDIDAIAADLDRFSNNLKDIQFKK